MGNAGEQPTNGLHGGRKNIPPQGPFGVLFRLWEVCSFVPHRQKTHQAEGLNRSPRVYRIDVGEDGRWRGWTLGRGRGIEKKNRFGPASSV